MKKMIWLVSILLSSTSMADEGLWLPQQLPELATQLKAKGLTVDAANIAKLTEFPMNTVVSLGGCSGAFVSAQGLVVTHHHCAEGGIQFHSQEQQNLLSGGFLAAQLQDEIPAAPSSKILLTEQIDNVTRHIQQELTPQLLGRDRFDKIEQLRKELVETCEGAAGYRCTLYSFDGGLAYYLVKQLEITDVRLVYAPAEGVGNFGGDVDNRQWPRHTGSYAFYRAYVGKDGKPAPYHADNIPFQSPAFLKISAKGVQADDFIMVIGYPQRTHRHLTAAELKLQFEHILPLTETYRTQTIRIIEEMTANNSALRWQYQSMLTGLRQRSHNASTLLQNYQQRGLQQRKDQQQLAFLQWLKAEPSRQARFLPALLDLESWIVQQKSSLERDVLMQAFDSIQLFSAARKLYRNAQERTKPDSEREIGYQQRDQLSFTSALQRLSRTLAPAVEVELAWFLLQQYHQLAPVDRVPMLDQYFNLTAGTVLNDTALQQLKQQLHQIYEKTELKDVQQLLYWQQQPLAAFAQSTDPMVQLAVALYPDEIAREQRQKTLAGKTSKLKPQVMAAWQLFQRSQQQQVYPDANGSLRVSFGTVQGYRPRDGVYYTPLSSVQGIQAKATGVTPFAAPAAQLQAIAQGDFNGYTSSALGTLPVNFLSTADTTAGHLGSATLNGQAELVGLLFDAVNENMLSDYDYDPALHRSIHVDSRYMLWQMDKVDGAARLLQEMVIVRQ